ncbi:hypothetical protein ACA910_008859 [Epithemia clementina (nom. ined.)]
MPAPSSPSQNRVSSSSNEKKHSPRQHSHSSRPPSGTGFPDLMSAGGPPKEVYITRMDETDDADQILSELLMADDQSVVSSLGVGEARAVTSKEMEQRHQEKQHNLDRVLDDTDEDPDKRRQGRIESPGIIAARERYKIQSTPQQRSSGKASLIHLTAGDHDGESLDEDLLDVEEISLGKPPHPEQRRESVSTKHKKGNSSSAVEVIDVEEIKLSRRSGGSKGSRHRQLQSDAKINTPSDDTSKTVSGSDESPGHHNLQKIPPRPEMMLPTMRKDSNKSQKKDSEKRKLEKKNQVKEDSNQDLDEEEEEEEDDDDEEEEEQSTVSNNTSATKELLDRAHHRIMVEKLQQEVNDLKQVVKNKNEEIKILGGQLRRAVETKCDLVLAHTEMEQFHEYILQAKAKEAHELLKENFATKEGVASVERDLMNEIVRLQLSLKEAQKQHVQELHDWERLHKNEMLERDCEIARLKAEVHKLVMMRTTSSSTAARHANPIIHTDLIEC